MNVISKKHFSSNGAFLQLLSFFSYLHIVGDFCCYSTQIPTLLPGMVTYHQPHHPSAPITHHHSSVVLLVPNNHVVHFIRHPRNILLLRASITIDNSLPRETKGEMKAALSASHRRTRVTADANRYPPPPPKLPPGRCLCPMILVVAYGYHPLVNQMELKHKTRTCHKTYSMIQR